MDVILYHGACPDGFVAAYIAKKRYPEAQLIPLDHGLNEAQLDDLFAKCDNKDVIMVDYSLRTRELNDKLYSLAKSFQILDHHKTAQATLEGTRYAIFDMKRSGAGLAWDFLWGKDRNAISENSWEGGFVRPWWVDYTEVRDLWQWSRYEDSKEVAAYLGTLKFEIEAWQKLEWSCLTKDQAAELGRGALAHIEHFVRESVKNVQPGIFEGYLVGIMNATYLNCSEIGNEIANNPVNSFSVTWFERDRDTIQFSLRSVGDFDVSAIAKKFNGGGHKNAAGFQLSIHEGRRLIDKIIGRPTEIQEALTRFHPDVNYGSRHG